MARYRAKAVTQRDGSALANSNCRMASIATGIDYHTLGKTTSTGAKMRSRQPDKAGGTDSSDAKLAWQSYGETLLVRDGSTWATALSDLKAGRMVHLDVWHATVGGPCLSGGGNYGHTMAVAPEQNGTRWLVADPWCSPGKWTWTEAAKLKAGAEKWGSQVFTEATRGRLPMPEAELIALMRFAARELMERYRPGREAIEDPEDTGGAAGRILFTITKAQPDAAATTEGDMAIQAATNLTSDQRIDVKQGLDFYADPDCTLREGELSKDATVKYIGGPIGEKVTGGARAILVSTGTTYGDGEPRPTVVYVKASEVPQPYTVTPPPPVTPPAADCLAEVAQAVAARDAAWETALQTGEAWPSKE